MNKLALFIGLSALVLFASCQPAEDLSYDTIITNGKIVDGSGNAWFMGDLAIRGDHIARIMPTGMLVNDATTNLIDASGMVVSPGFIDIQSHSRGAFLNGDGRVLSKITQGITTEIMGEGWTNAPANEQTVVTIGSEEEVRFGGDRGFNDWLLAMKANGVSPNIGSFIGASTIRSYVKGMTMGNSSPDEIAEMQRITENAMQDGGIWYCFCSHLPTRKLCFYKRTVSYL